MKKSYTALKIMTNNPNNVSHILQHEESDIDSNAKALFFSKEYEQIFGKTKKSSSQKHQRLSIVKITHGKRVIYRSFQARGVVGLDGNYIGLSPNAWYELGLDEKVKDGQLVSVTKGWWFYYFWEHPNSATRMSFRIGIIAIFIGFVSLFPMLKDLLLNFFNA